MRSTGLLTRSSFLQPHTFSVIQEAKLQEISTVEPVIDSADALRGFIVSTVFLVTCFVVPMNLIVTIVGFAFSLTCLTVFSVALLFPDQTKRGIALFDGGFEFHAPMRTKKRILFSDILRIEGVCRGDGGTGDEVPFLLTTTHGDVFLPESDLYGTDVIKRLFDLPGFRRDVYSDAAAYELPFRESFSGKKFLLYERA